MDFEEFNGTDELTAREILIQVSDSEEHLHRTPLLREQDFQLFYSVIKNFSKIEHKHIDRIWALAFKTASHFQKETESNTTIFESQDYCHSLRKILYIICGFIEQFEDAESSSSYNKAFNESLNDAGDTRQKKKRKIDTSNKDTFKEYERYKDRALKCILQLITLPINRVTNSTSAAQELVTKTAMRAAYKLIENSSVNGLTKSKELVEYTFMILGSGIEKYNQSLTFCLKFIQLLQYKEQLASLLSQLVHFIVDRHQQRLLIGEILREIDRIDIRELSRDASCPRAVSTFLVDLSERCPQEFLPHLSHLLGYLDQESYLMRNASLSVIGNILIHQKESENIKLRDELIDCIIAHTKDITSYTRSKALSVLCILSQANCIPLCYIDTAANAAISRLHDKSCFVRRNATKYLIYALNNNPFHVNRLPIKVFQDQLDIEKKKKKLEEEDVTIEENATEEEEMSSKKIKYLEETIRFITLIHSAIPFISDLLYSKNITDVQEAIDFFVTCHDFGIDEALVGFKRMILLITTSEKSVKDAITNAYKRIYFESNRYEGKSDKDRVAMVVTNLINFVQTATIGEFLSINLLFKQFMESKDFTKAHEQELFARFTMKKPEATVEDAVASIQILSMLASFNHNIINHNFELCVSHGLDVKDNSEPNCRLIRETCIALQKSLPKKIGVEERLRLTRLSKDADVFGKITNILYKSIVDLDFHHWYSVCDQAVRVIFRMSENPEQICETIFVNIIENAKFDADTIHPVILARFIHFVGDIALNMAVHLELDVFFELKIRNNKVSEEKDTSIRDPNLSVSARRRSSRRFDQGNQEDDIGLGGANALEDVEMEFLEGICDEEIVSGDSLLASMATLIVEVAKDPIQFSHLEVKKSASLALAKYMMVSEKFCSEYLRLLFTILERSKEGEIKINLLVAISDLCIRFPNLLDGWTQKLFDCLENDNVQVKQTALKVLSRLILSDNIKVKGQISNIANLMVDDDELLASCSRHFFTELAKKLNAIYNLIPDLISRLSDSEKGVSEEKFKIVMAFLFELIDKDRHIDRLIDKLCHRFTDTIDERHWRDLAYCLTLLKYSDRAIAKLLEKFDTYKDKLCFEFVNNSITSIVTQHRKTPNLKNETKLLLDEFEAKLQGACNLAVE